MIVFTAYAYNSKECLAHVEDYWKNHTQKSILCSSNTWESINRCSHQTVERVREEEGKTHEWIGKEWEGSSIDSVYQAHENQMNTSWISIAKKGEHLNPTEPTHYFRSHIQQHFFFLGGRVHTSSSSSSLSTHHASSHTAHYQSHFPFSFSRMNKSDSMRRYYAFDGNIFYIAHTLTCWYMVYRHVMMNFWWAVFFSLI